MTETKINLNPELSEFISNFKLKTGIHSDEKAILEIISEYKNKDFDKELSLNCSLASEKSLSENWNSKEDEENFAYLQQ